MTRTQLDRKLVSLTNPASLEAEQYQHLSLALQRLRTEQDVRMIALASPAGGDGKTLTSINLAATLARGSDARVLLIEADLRRPTLASHLPIDDSRPGLTDIVLNPNATLPDAVQELPFGFSVISAGSSYVASGFSRTTSRTTSRLKPAPTHETSPHIHDILKSPRLQALLAEARERHDFVIVDTPPIVPVADARLLAQSLDGLFLVVAVHKTPRKLLEEALNVLDSNRVLGIILNRDDRPFFGYSRRYYQGYFPAAIRTGMTAP
jgi:Mrp family chromosome partitioning ATPase